MVKFIAPRSITTWTDLAQKFLAKYFPPSKTAKLRNDIKFFTQIDNESIYEAWKRFKEMLRKCPHHSLPDWLVIQIFYNGLVGSIENGQLLPKPHPKERSLGCLKCSLHLSCEKRQHVGRRRNVSTALERR